MPKPKCDLEFYYDNRASCYWLRHPGKSFLKLTDRQVKLHLSMNGVDLEEYTKVEHNGVITSVRTVDKMLYMAQFHRAVDYAGPVAGRKIGTFTAPDGRSILVTSQALIVEPKRGEWPFLKTFLSTLLAPDNEATKQMTYFMLWCKFAYEALVSGDFRPAPMLVLAGEGGCGKSFAQILITHLLGGRVACPWRYMVEKTNFNWDLAGAEHLAIEDKSSSTDIRARRALGEQIKQITVVENWSVQKKGQDSCNFNTYKRATMTINNEPEKIAVLPPLDRDLKDKIALLLCAKGKLHEERPKNMSEMTNELPAFIYACLKLKVPSWMDTHERYGVAAIHHPALMEILTGLSPEARLLDYIDQELGDDPFSGSASELEIRLMRNQDFGPLIGKLLPNSSSCGTLLSRLKSQLPDRFRNAVIHGKTRWTIIPAPKEATE
jgi:hypothetical protein